jgi:hypothetical protein
MTKPSEPERERWEWTRHSILFYVVVVGVLYGAGHALWGALTEDGLWLSILRVAGILAVAAFVTYFLLRVGAEAVRSYKREMRR